MRYKKRNGLKVTIIVITTMLMLVGIVPANRLAAVGMKQPMKSSERVVADVNSEKPEAKEAGANDVPTQPGAVNTNETAVQQKAEEITLQETIEAEPEKEAYTVEDMQTILYAQKSSNVRKGPSTDYEVIGGLSLNQEAQITGKASTGWYRISYKGGEGFVAGSLLKETMVEIQPEPVVNPETPKNRWEYTEAELIQLAISECITPDMSDWDKAVAVNNYLMNLMSYDYTYSHHSTFDALAYGQGVCQGYANAYKKIMNALGMTADYVSGWANGGRHAWNRVLIGETYYYVDSCWNDCLSTTKWLMISYEQMSVDHEQWEINRKRIE